MSKARLIAATGLCVVVGSHLFAQDVVIVLPSEAESIRSNIERDSLTFTLEDVAPGSAQDYVAAARSDYRRLLTGLYSLGYYGGSISILIDGREAASIAPLDAPDRIDEIRIIVDPGPVFTFGRTEIAPLAPGTLLPESFAPGQVAGSDLIGDAVREGVNGWRDVGFARAAPGAQQITAIHAEDRLDVTVALEPGPQLTFGDLIVSGNSAVRTERIVAIAGLPDGDLYSPQAIEDATRRLRRSGAFQSVVLTEADQIGPGNTLDINAQVAEMLPRRFGFGAEISSLDGASVNAFWLHRNLLGGAEELRIDAEITGIEGRRAGPDALIELTFGRPGTFHPDIDVELSAVAARIDEPTFFLEFVGAGVGATRYIREDLTYEGQLLFITARETTALGTRNYTLATLPLSAELDRRDDPFDAKKGYFINLEAAPFLGIVGGSNGARLYADTRYYHSFGSRFTLAARGQLGSLLGADILEAPADFLFYSGGTDTVRGQPYNGLGATVEAVADDGTTFLVETGGASFVGAQFEARVGITGSIGVVGFYDAGFVDSAEFPSDTGEFQSGAGIGVRYATPIGPIRLDIATPASGDNAGQDIEFYIGIGQSF